MRNARFGKIIVCMVTTMLGCRAPATSWNGTWKLNTTKSSFKGPVITISISPDDEYHYDDGVVNVDSRCDGKYRSIGHNRTQNCVQISSTKLDKTRMQNGIKTNTYEWELSADGKVFTATATALRPSGPVITGRLVASRMSGSNGFAGQWRDTSFLQRHAELTLKLDNQYLHISYPGAGQYVDAPLNGIDTAMYGPNAVPGTTHAVRRIGQREFIILGKINGRTINQEFLKLSDDGRSITESWWNSDRPPAKVTLVYERK